MMVAARKGWPSARTEYAAPTGLKFYFGFGSTNMPRRRRWDERRAKIILRWTFGAFGV
jgi:hypothetical protein